MRPNTRNHSRDALLTARKFRAEMSISEKVLWECLRRDRLGFRFKRQVSTGIYTLDFYCTEASLCVEVDGEQHRARQSQDALRDEWLGKNRIATIRIPSLDLFDEAGIATSEWLRLVQQTCEDRSGRSAFTE